jgi:IS5 family transposase
VHTVTTTAANVADVTETDKLLHGKEKSIHGDAGYTGADKRDEVKDSKAQWHIAAKRGKIKAMPEDALKEATQALETIKAAIRSRVEHPFRVIKCQFGYQKVRFKGLAKNTVQVITLFALSNLWMARKQLMSMTGEVRPQGAG